MFKTDMIFHHIFRVHCTIDSMANTSTKSEDQLGKRRRSYDFCSDKGTALIAFTLSFSLSFELLIKYYYCQLF